MPKKRVNKKQEVKRFRKLFVYDFNVYFSMIAVLTLFISVTLIMSKILNISLTMVNIISNLSLIVLQFWVIKLIKDN